MMTGRVAERDARATLALIRREASEAKRAGSSGPEEGKSYRAFEKYLLRPCSSTVFFVSRRK